MSAPICTWPSCKCTARDQCKGLGGRADLCAADERVKALEAENARLRRIMREVLSKLDRDGMKPGWGVVRGWLRAALRDMEGGENVS